MDMERIEKEFDNFFEFNSDNKSMVTSFSAKLFAQHIADIDKNDGSKDGSARALIASLNSALARIADHVGATCCGVDVDENDPGHTATAIISKINDIIAE